MNSKVRALYKEVVSIYRMIFRWERFWIPLLVIIICFLINIRTPITLLHKSEEWLFISQKATAYERGKLNYRFYYEASPHAPPALTTYISIFLYKLQHSDPTGWLLKLTLSLYYALAQSLIFIISRKTLFISPILATLVAISKHLRLLFLIHPSSITFMTPLILSSIYFAAESKFYLAIICFGIASSMDIFAYAMLPGLLVLVWEGKGLIKTIILLAACLMYQICLAAPFLSSSIIAYYSNSLVSLPNIPKCSSVSFAFLPNLIFSSSFFWLITTAVQYAILAYLFISKWLPGLKGLYQMIARKNVLYKQHLDPRYTTRTLVTSVYCFISVRRNLSYNMAVFLYVLYPFIVSQSLIIPNIFSIAFTLLYSIMLSCNGITRSILWTILSVIGIGHSMFAPKIRRTLPLSVVDKLKTEQNNTVNEEYKSYGLRRRIHIEQRKSPIFNEIF